MTSRKSIAARQDLAREGEKPTGMYLILEGWAMRCRQRADGSRQILAILLPGDLAIDPPHRPLNHAICSLTQVRYGLIPHPHFGEDTSELPEFMAALWRRQLETASIQLEWIANNGRSAYERIAHFLCETYARARCCGLASGNECEFPLTQQDLASVTGLTSVHVNRTLQHMRKDGLIELHGKRLVLLKPDGLGQAATFDAAYLRWPPAARALVA
jgi:CRP-like cAMP-binding protein|uniref:Crp/Fnr family transcriptional regulator n=1 Tax=Altererythrobacter segetis TaxID=1104773 RepID=UPI00140A6D4F|nr:Crp/Fnr family transcriptional regulator [Altererythrobacter segetis]